MQDPLVGYLIRHCTAGVLAGWVTLGLLLGLDVYGLGTLVYASDLWPLPLLVLLTFLGLTFGSVAVAAAIMSIGREDSAPSAWRKPAPVQPGKLDRDRPHSGAR